MKEYVLETKEISEETEKREKEEGKKEICVCIMTEEEFEQTAEENRCKKEFLESFRHGVYCKAEIYLDCFTGVIRIPDKKRPEGKPKILGFYVRCGRMVFLDSSSHVTQFMKEIQREEISFQGREPQILLKVFDSLIEEDVSWLQRFEERITDLEDILLEGTPRELPQILMRLRRECVKFHNFYLQLLDVAEELQGHFALLMSQEQKSEWNVFTNRLSRLHDYTESIRENLLQLHELYQAQVDIQQNEIMKVLTVVTTVFLPLSLLTGWYGMNFEGILLLDWKYGYPAVILFTLVTILLELGYFRKKGFLRHRKGAGSFEMEI